MKRSVTLPLFYAFCLAASASQAEFGSLEFGGGISADHVDRILIPVDDPATAEDGPPADVGASDFTIEVWLKADENNRQPAIKCHEFEFVLGNIIIDRDRYNQGQSYGLSLTDGRATFSVQTADYHSTTVCGSIDLRDGRWHHVAIQRRSGNGEISVYVDGELEARAIGPAGSIAYPDDGACADPSICADSDHYLVVGAEKHNLSHGFSGRVAQLRISDVIRFPGEQVSSQPLQADDATLALYSFWLGESSLIEDLSGSGQGPAQLRFGVGGGKFAGPRFVSDSPFTQ